MPPLQNVCVVTTFYTLVGILSILFSGVALIIIICRGGTACRDGGIVKVIVLIQKNNPSASHSFDSSLYTREPTVIDTSNNDFKQSILSLVSIHETAPFKSHWKTLQLEPK